MVDSVRVRFAPSPTGPLHIGGVRTALYNYLYAKKNNGSFLLRVEDTDQKRTVSDAEEYIYSALEWLGIVPDESPKHGGSFGPYRQSERKEVYEKWVQILIDKGLAYYAFDAPEELEAHRKEHEKKGKTFIYNWHNRLKLKNSLSVSAKEVNEKIKSGAPYVVRFLMWNNGDDEVVRCPDIIRGNVDVDCKLLDDKILYKSDGFPTYHFANVVDDHLMKISHVIRGEEWLPSLALHIKLYDAFGWTAPAFAHLPLILKSSGKGKLSKRDGDQLGFPVYPLEWENSKGFKEKGFLPEALLSYLSLLGWNPGSEKEIFELKELIHLFEVEKIQKGGARFDFDKARWVNHKFLANSDSKLILERFPSFFNVVGANVSEKRKLAIYGLLKERLFLLEDFKSEASLFFSDPVSYDEKVIKKIQDRKPKKVLNFIIQILEKNIPASNWKKQLQSWGEKEELPFSVIMQSLRLAIVGNLSGPDILVVCGLLEKEVILKRLKKLINYLNN